jgi:hypothetical protein
MGRLSQSPMGWRGSLGERGLEEAPPGLSPFAPKASDCPSELWRPVPLMVAHQIPMAAPGLKCQSLWLPLDRRARLSSVGCPRQLLWRNRDKCVTKLEYDGCGIMHLIRSWNRVLIKS